MPSHLMGMDPTGIICLRCGVCGRPGQARDVGWFQVGQPARPVLPLEREPSYASESVHEVQSTMSLFCLLS